MRSNRKAKLLALPGAGLAALFLAGCSSEQIARGWMPGEAGVTNHTDAITGLWVNAWIILLGVGVIVWGLVIFAVIAYRRRKGQTGLPPQMRYNMPVEIFFTLVPLILILGMFAFTLRVQTPLEVRHESPDVTVEVYAKQWAWDFNYLNKDGTPNVYDTGIQIQPTDGVGAYYQDENLPRLYLPVGKQVELQLKSRDVAHSFWVIEFLYKKDLIPFKTNYMSFIPQKEGVYMGKCAELCGQYHSAMLFEIVVVSEAEYEAHLKSLPEGRLGDEYNRDVITWEQPWLEESK
ncbi:MAG: cytochrome c oxidase subunit II [Microbacteriaceae bacterium]